MTRPAAMSGVQLVRHGGPEALVWRDDLPVPQPGPGEVLVRIRAAGLCHSDLSVIDGNRPRPTPMSSAPLPRPRSSSFPC